MEVVEVASINGKYVNEMITMEITNGNESKGTCDVKFTRWGSNYNFKGGFSFYPDEKRTVLWFHDSDNKWRVVAKYMADGSRQYDTWEGRCNSANDDSTMLYTFKLHKA